MQAGADIAFAGAGGQLDRAAYLRRDQGKMAALYDTGQITPIWRGKVAFCESQAQLLWLTAGHPALAQAGAILFLGLVDGQARFACDVSAWQPAEGTVAEGGFFDQSIQPHPEFAAGSGFADLRGVMTQLSAFDAECAATAKALMSWHDSHRFCAKCGAASQMQDAGWQRHCPACNSPHFPRTDPVVIMLVTRGDRLLLGRSPAWPEGMYSLLAGFVEPGETLEAAVRREVFEETGVQVGRVRYLASQPWPFPASLMLGCIGEATSEAITLDPAELEDARWLTRQEVLEVQLNRHAVVKAGRKGAIAQALIQQWLAGHVD